MSAVVHWSCDCCGAVEKRDPKTGRPEHWHQHGIALEASSSEPLLICPVCQKAIGEFIVNRRKEFARTSETMRVGKAEAP